MKLRDFQQFQGLGPEAMLLIRGEDGRLYELSAEPQNLNSPTGAPVFLQLRVGAEFAPHGPQENFVTQTIHQDAAREADVAAGVPFAERFDQAAAGDQTGGGEAPEGSSELTGGPLADTGLAQEGGDVAGEDQAPQPPRGPGDIGDYSSEGDVQADEDPASTGAVDSETQAWSEEEQANNDESYRGSQGVEAQPEEESRSSKKRGK